MGQIGTLGRRKEARTAKRISKRIRNARRAITFQLGPFFEIPAFEKYVLEIFKNWPIVPDVLQNT